MSFAICIKCKRDVTSTITCSGGFYCFGEMVICKDCLDRARVILDPDSMYSNPIVVGIRSLSDVKIIMPPTTETKEGSK